jgi:hypothetical protein
LINSRREIVNALAVTIKPLFGWLANAAMARATDWITANWPTKRLG